MSTKVRLRALFGLVVICTTWIIGCGEDKPAAPANPAPPAGGAPPAPDDATKPKAP